MLIGKIIYFVRHGESELNIKGIRQGAEGSLSARGRAQAEITAKKFPKKKGRPEVIISSPYERARETAEIIGKELGMKTEFCDLLIERRNPSQIIGRSIEEREVRIVVDQMDKTFHDDNFRYSDEENFLDLKERAKKLLAYIKKRKEKRIIMVTHMIFLKVIIAHMLYGQELTASLYNTLSYFNPIDNAGMTIVKYVPHWLKRDEWKILAWNDEG